MVAGHALGPGQSGAMSSSAGEEWGWERLIGGTLDTSNYILRSLYPFLLTKPVCASSD